MKLNFFTIALASLLLLTGCTPRPYSTNKITSYLENFYGAKGRFELKETISTEKYIYYDNQRDVTFKVSAVTYGLGQNAIVPLPHRQIYPSLNQGIIESKKEEALTLAQKHGVTLTDEGSIYVTDFSQLDGASALFFGLAKLYQLEKAEGISGDIIFYYCANPQEPDNRIQLDFFSYIQVMEDGSYLFFENEEQLSNRLKEKWKAIEQWNDLIPKSY